MADLREKLVELLNRKYDHYCDQCGVNKDSHYTENLADYLISNGVTIQKWVPVRERLPEIPDGWAENPEPVLYMMASTRTIMAGYYGEGGVYRDKYFREYHDRYEGCDADDVLCWMWQHELPEPPGEVE